MITGGIKSQRLVLAMTFGIAATCCPAWADPIFVDNPSFEADVLCDGCIAESIIGWGASAGGGDGAFNPTTSHYPAGAIPDGQNVAYVNSPGNHVNQTLSAVLVADTTYTLEVEVGNRLDIPFAGYTVQLRAGGAVLASDSSQTPADGQFLTSTVTYVSSPSDPSWVCSSRSGCWRRTSRPTSTTCDWMPLPFPSS
ncbi:MAG: hypothetical protein HC897_12920 [Thermoanaerobaculia bacterium]|nr:hypothetical protein [Thermoanaerobaculia bacterium]